ncbi:type II secretion system protein [Sporosarcina sp.]|uniref:PulJ/GspJ family protein n=1 Tax=Sporosarcina sp. TaxID=49982 RepID=UPI002629834D|nr:type II secretion system protein [Sporosarcina sp.]
MKVDNEKGMTLVEILAALTILGIVFVGFMTIFPQMNTMNNRTEAKLETMNMAKQELVKLRDSPNSLFNLDLEINYDLGDYERYEKEIEKEKDSYLVEIDCYNNELTNQSCSGDGEVEGSRKKELYKIHIKITKDTKLTSETFGYLMLD